MVGRDEKKIKCCRWGIYFPSTKQAKASRQVLREVILAGRTDIEFVEELKFSRVVLVWAQPVTFDSAARLIRFARQKCGSFEVFGEPYALVDVPAVTTTASATEGEETKNVVAAAVAAKPAESKPKKQRLTRKQNATEPASGPFSQTVTCPFLLPLGMLSLKLAELRRQFSRGNSSDGDSAKYDLDLEKLLGEGTYGSVYAATAPDLPLQPLAIKLLVTREGDASHAALAADEEVRRFVGLPSHPCIVKLLDVGIFQGKKGLTTFGLVFDRYDADVRQMLRATPLKEAGIRHVLRSVLAALAFMHGSGLMHTDVTSGNILLRGAEHFRTGWLQMLAKSNPHVEGGGSASASGAASASAATSSGGRAQENAAHELRFHLAHTFEVRGPRGRNRCRYNPSSHEHRIHERRAHEHLYDRCQVSLGCSSNSYGP